MRLTVASGMPKRRAGGRKAAGLHRGDEQRHGFEAIHGSSGNWKDRLQICHLHPKDGRSIRLRMPEVRPRGGFHERPHLHQRRRLHADGQGDPDAQGLARRLCPRRGARRLARRASRPTSPPSSRRRPASSSSTANGEGQPYIQHRGGPAGFLKVLDEKTIGFADFSGNRQFITQGNLADNTQGLPVPDRLCASAAHQDLGHGARRRGRCRADGEADAGGLQGAPRAGHPVHRLGLGCQLPAAYSAAFRGRRRGGGTCRTRQAD